MEFRRITVNPRQMAGVPCIRGLRIPVATVVGMIADGMKDEEILKLYPDLEAGDLQEALRFAAEAIADAIHDSQPDWSQFATKEFVRSELKDLEVRLGERLRSQLILFFTVQAGFFGVGAALFKFLSK